MQDENNFRQQLGISQELLANLLGISRDLLAQYELGRRTIPSNALLRLARMETLLQKTFAQPATKSDNAVSSIATSNQRLLQFARRCSFEAEKEARKLAAIEKTVEQCNRLLQIIPALKKELAGDNSVEMATLNLLEQKAREKTKKFNEETLTILRIRISGLQHQAAEALASAG